MIQHHCENGRAIVNRFKQVKPRVLLTVDRFVHGGEEVNMLQKVENAVQNLPSLEKVLIVASKSDSYSKDISGIKSSCFLEEFLKLGVEEDGSVPEMQFEQVSFSHPVIISYTSGTTGLPKPIVHGSGILMSVSSSFGVTIDTDRDSVWMSVSPVGWASWSMYTTLQFLGQKIVLYEGNFYYLTPTYVWNLVDKHKISHILFPSSVVDELEKRKYLPTEKHDLSSLKYLMAGGSVVKRGSFDFMNKILPHVLFSGAYGCTEVMGCCLVTEMTLPVYKAEINASCIGTAVEIVDESGNPVIGEVGEVVLSKPIPGLALGLWGDTDGSAFREKYFSKYKGIFAMGDYGIINPLTKGWIICCRSDETLKQRGCRFGSSEIYNIVEKFPEVRNSLCVSHYNKDMDEKAVLFLKIKEGYSYSEELVNRIRKAIAGELTVRHVPDIIIETPDIPYNLNGKKMEIIVKKIINKMNFSYESIANPESLQYYCNVPALHEC
ncbi:Acetoacetyl-CoA synthetase like protein [Argiope bruennichi]|uniref:Acetoacetyl-CoA synthetase like protein n=1 Tax=Argiope bruennichi TaxID=94029 RepID=A0A8T0EB68_ARGBR|nr:Acetoacetyl-CoA synthetase like protein [Argiope bruennichi]